MQTDPFVCGMLLQKIDKTFNRGFFIILKDILPTICYEFHIRVIFNFKTWNFILTSINFGNYNILIESHFLCYFPICG